MIERKKIEELIQERIAELDNGLFVVDLSISPSDVIHVELDKHQGGVSVDDCVAVSRNIEHNLDRDAHDFELTVSSAGIDRPLRVHAQYEKNVGRTIEVLLKNGEKKQGILTQVEPTSFSIEQIHKKEVEGKKKKENISVVISISFEDVKETKLVISFK